MAAKLFDHMPINPLIGHVRQFVGTKLFPFRIFLGPIGTYPLLHKAFVIMGQVFPDYCRTRNIVFMPDERTTE